MKWLRCSAPAAEEPQSLQAPSLGFIFHRSLPFPVGFYARAHSVQRGKRGGAMLASVAVLSGVF